MNVTRPPLNNRLVRRALAMALDRQSIVDSVMHGAQLPASCFTPPNTAGYTCQSSIPYDVGLARKTLAQAGYPNGLGLPPIEILFNTSENHKLIAEALQQMWRQNLNVAATLVNQEEKVYSIRGVRTEAILLEDAPILPVYFYTHAFLIRPSLKGWYPTILDHHPYKYVHLE